MPSVDVNAVLINQERADLLGCNVYKGVSVPI
jgi:hypothetical protein